MSSDLINPLEDPDEWDKFSVGDIEAPGIAKLSGFKRVYSWEIIKGKGVKGSTTILNEFPPCEGTVTLYFWTREHFRAWRDFKSRFLYDPTKKTVTAVKIYHPSLADIQCNDVVCKSIGAIEHMGQGLYQVVIELIEYNPPPPKPAVAVVTQSKDELEKERMRARETPGLDSRDDVETTLRKLQNQLKAAGADPNGPTGIA